MKQIAWTILGWLIFSLSAIAGTLKEIPYKGNEQLYKNVRQAISSRIDSEPSSPDDSREPCCYNDHLYSVAGTEKYLVNVSQLGGDASPSVPFSWVIAKDAEKLNVIRHKIPYLITEFWIGKNDSFTFNGEYLIDYTLGDGPYIWQDSWYVLPVTGIITSKSISVRANVSKFGYTAALKRLAKIKQEVNKSEEPLANRKPLQIALKHAEQLLDNAPQKLTAEEYNYAFKRKD